MTSWRDTASAIAQDDLENLLDAVLPFAEQQLGSTASSSPFGSTVSVDGQVALLAADPGGRDRPGSQLMLDALYRAARLAVDDLRAVAFVADVRRGVAGDAGAFDCYVSSSTCSPYTAIWDMSRSPRAAPTIPRFATIRSARTVRRSNSSLPRRRASLS